MAFLLRKCSLCLTWVLGIEVRHRLYLVSLRSYLLFHSLIEIFSIVVAFAIFIIAWNTRRLLENHFLLFITMPALTGARLAGEVLNILPDIPIIPCTGYSVILSKEKALEIGIKKYLFKPLGSKELARTVRKVLDEKYLTFKRLRRKNFFRVLLSWGKISWLFEGIFFFSVYTEKQDD